MAAARAVLQGAPGRRDLDDALRAFGLDLAQVGALAAAGAADEPADDGLAVWPDNADAVRLFAAMLTQWRIGHGGPIGLDYGVLPVVARHLGLRKRRLQIAFTGLQVMEAEALAWFTEQLPPPSPARH
jgi:hypothetical protein